MTGELALALGVVFAVNLLPAFGPPTWAVLVFFSLDYDLPAVPLVLGGALAAASGRYLLAGLGLFALSPVPSGQLFVAAGLMTVPLLPLTAAFFAGRLVSYSIYVSAASIAERNLGDVALDALTSPLGMALQLAMLLALGVLLGGVHPGERPSGRLWSSPDGRRPPGS